MSTSRRGFLELLAKAGLVGLTAPSLGVLEQGCLGGSSVPSVSGLLIGALDGELGEHYLGGLDLETGAGFRVPVPSRGHSVALHPALPDAVLASRRPGTELYVVDRFRGELVHTIACPAGRHLLGHATFDLEGERLFVPENVFEEGSDPDVTPRDSVIALYDVGAGYRRVGEWSSQGVGAHELRVMPDGRSLAIANGGIYTHPRWPGEGLNLDSMDPSLVLLDLDDGALLSQHRPPHPQLSVRHIDLGGDGSIVVGMQFQGDPEEEVPLVAVDRGMGLVPLDLPEEVRVSLDQYIAGVAIHEATGHIAATSPRGDLAVFFSAEEVFMGAIEAEDVSGCAATPEGFLVTATGGRVIAVDPLSLAFGDVFSVVETRWDNHFSLL